MHKMYSFLERYGNISMKKLATLLMSAVIVLALGNVFVLAEPETESVVSVEEVTSAIETESAVSQEDEVVSSEEATVSENTVSYVEPEEFQKEVNINKQVAKEEEGVATVIGIVAWTIAGVSMAGLFVIAVAAFIKYRNRRR